MEDTVADELFTVLTSIVSKENKKGFFPQKKKGDSLDQTQEKVKETVLESAMSAKEVLSQKVLTKICAATGNNDFCLSALVNESTNCTCHREHEHLPLAVSHGAKAVLRLKTDDISMMLPGSGRKVQAWRRGHRGKPPWVDFNEVEQNMQDAHIQFKKMSVKEKDDIKKSVTSKQRNTTDSNDRNQRSYDKKKGNKGKEETIRLFKNGKAILVSMKAVKDVAKNYL